MDTFNTLQSFKNGKLYSLPALGKKLGVKVERLPISIRIVLESVLRNVDGKKVTEEHVRELANWSPKGARTDEIPNDTVSVRKGLEPAMMSTIRDGLLEVSKTADGQNLLKTLYNINGLATAQDSEYESVRSAAKVLNLNLEQELAPR